MYVPVFWNRAKTPKPKPVIEYPAAQRPKVAPKQIVPKPESYVLTITAKLVKYQSYTAVAHLIWDSMNPFEIPIAMTEEMTMYGSAQKLILNNISGSLISESESSIQAAITRGSDQIANGRLTEVVLKSAWGRQILPLQEALYALTVLLLDDL